MSSRQGSIVGFFARPPAKSSKPKQPPKSEVKDEIIDLTTDTAGVKDEDIKPTKSPRKRRKLSPKVEGRSPPVEALDKGETGAKPDRLTIDLSAAFTYPPSDHASYRLPPDPGYNHPFTIAPPPESLLANLSFSQSPKPIIRPSLNLDLLYFNQFISPPGSRELYEYLLESMPWYRVKYTVRGININTPRWTTVFGKDGSTHSWTGYPVKPRAIPEILLRLMEIVEKVTGETYNFTLVNYYATGDDSISYHSDSESFLGPDPCIASLSLGSSRDFMLRHIDYKTNGCPIEKFALKDGDMVVMRGGTQKNWMHAVPKRKGKGGVGGRINITFRKGVVRYATKNYADYNVGKGPMYRWIKGEMVEQK